MWDEKILKLYIHIYILTVDSYNINHYINKMNESEQEQNDLNQNFDNLMEATPQLEEQLLEDDMQISHF